MERETGRCLCGAVTFSFEGPARWVAHCHCESCRRTTSSPFTTFVGVPRTAARFTGAAPKVYHSSLGVRRSFCGTCGAPVAYESERCPDEIHFYVCSLSDPAAVVPECHVNTAEQLPWIALADSLPRHPGTGS